MGILVGRTRLKLTVGEGRKLDAASAPIACMSVRAETSESWGDSLAALASTVTDQSLVVDLSNLQVMILIN